MRSAAAISQPDPSLSARPAAAIAWIGGLVGGLALLHGAGGAVAGTPVLEVMRVLGLAAGSYLLVATALGVGARLARRTALVRWADVLTVPTVHRLLDAVVGVSWSVTAMGAPSAAAWAASPPPVVEAAGVEDPAAVLDEASEAVPTGSVPTGSVPSMSVVGSMPSTTVAAVPVDGPPAMAREPPTTAVPEPPSSPGSTWVVQARDHFWSIAERVLASSWGRPPTDRETDRYWRTLVAVNRDRLADGSNPDLLFVGQVLVLPPLPARS